MRHYESADAFLALLFVSLSFLVLWLELILGLTIDVDLDFFLIINESVAEGFADLPPVYFTKRRIRIAVHID